MNIIENGLDYPSSNPEQGSLQFTYWWYLWEKVWIQIFSHQQTGLFYLGMATSLEGGQLIEGWTPPGNFHINSVPKTDSDYGTIKWWYIDTYRCVYIFRWKVKFSEVQIHLLGLDNLYTKHLILFIDCTACQTIYQSFHSKNYGCIFCIRNI